jgi:phage antirepressor YoqD-like protein
MSTASSSSLHPVPFYKDTIYAAEHGGELYAPVRPLVENLGIMWSNQFTKLKKNRERFCVLEIRTQLPGDDQSRRVVCIPVRKLAGFLATIDPRKCREEVRDKLRLYQAECDDALWQYWHDGRADNPRAERKAGLPEMPFQIPETLPDALRLAADLAEDNQRISAELETARPKVAFADAIEGTKKSVRVGDFAQVVRNSGVPMGQKRLFRWLRDHGYLRNNNIPYQKYLDMGWFEVVEKERYSDNGPVPYFQTRITGRGQIALTRRIVSQEIPQTQTTLAFRAAVKNQY